MQSKHKNVILLIVAVCAVYCFPDHNRALVAAKNYAQNAIAQNDAGDDEIEEKDGEDIFSHFHFRD